MEFYMVDCFAEEQYQGNQLAVFLPDRELTKREMQQIANEVGFSESSFILSGKRENGGYDVRIFTPAVELPFAGHPALGTAYVIREILERGAADRVVLNLQAGQVSVAADRDGLRMWQHEPQFGETLEKSLLAGVLSLEEKDIRDDYPVQWVSTGLEAVIVPLNSRDALERCRVDHDKFQQFIQQHYKCSILAFVQEGHGIRDRVFTDDPGFLEDPATGSANGALAGYLLKHDFFGCSRIRYEASQGSEMGRPSRLRIEASLADGKYTIQVGGKVCLVAKGDWLASEMGGRPE